MEVDFKFDVKHIADNEIAYFNMLENAVTSVDYHSFMRIDKTPLQYLFRITPSSINNINSIIEQINNLNNALHLKVNFGKSFKNSANIFFSLET